MARSIGVDPGGRVVKVVELDGSYRKTKLVRVHTVPVGGADDDPLRVDHVAAAVREAMDTGMKGDVALGFPCREAVLRNIELPFKGADAIKKVVKSEIESEIYTHSVDDMVVDFHEIGEGVGGGTRLLVASVPKDGLRNQLEALSAENVDPEVVDLDTMALWRTAHWCGAFDADDEADADVPAVQESSGELVHAVLDLGSRSVRVILVEGEQLVEMRALRLGDAVVGEQLARQYGLDPSEAREGVRRSLASGSDMHASVVGDAAGDEADGEELVLEDGLAEDTAGAPADDADASEAATPAVAARASVTIPYDVVEAAHTKYLQRLARELTRFLTSTEVGGRIDKVWVTGSACRGHGVAEMLEAVFSHPVQELDILGNLSHDLDSVDAEELEPQLAAAIGLALGRMGGPEGLQLRQEDLALVHGFERIKFPLAIACMVALLAMFVYGNRRAIERKHLELQIGRQYHDPKDPDAVIFYGMLGPVFSGKKWFEDNFRFEQKSGNVYQFSDLTKEVLAAPVYDRIKIVRNRMREVVNEKRKASGIHKDISLESGLAVLVRWSEVLKGVEPELGRYLVPDLNLNMKGPNRTLKFQVAFRGGDFRTRMDILRTALDRDMQQPDSPFGGQSKNVDRKLEVVEKPFDDKDNTGVQGAFFDVIVPVRANFHPFGA